MAATTPGAEPTSAATNEIKKVRQRSSAYTAHTISACVTFTKKIDGHFSNVTYTHPDLISKALKQAGGNFLMLLSSSAQYGLLDKSSGEGYKPSAHFKKIDRPLPEENVEDLRLECFTKPTLYRKLIKQFKDKQLPSEIGLANILERNYSIFGPASEQAAKIFFLNAEALKVIADDHTLRIDIEIPDEEERREFEEDVTTQKKKPNAWVSKLVKPTQASPKPPIVTPPPTLTLKTKEIPIFLKENREAKLVLPADFDDEDIRKAVKVLSAYLT